MLLGESAVDRGPTAVMSPLIGSSLLVLPSLTISFLNLLLKLIFRCGSLGNLSLNDERFVALTHRYNFSNKGDAEGNLAHYYY